MSYFCIFYSLSPAPARLRVRLFRKRDRTRKTRIIFLPFERKKTGAPKIQNEKKIFLFWNANSSQKNLQTEAGRRRKDKKINPVSEKEFELERKNSSVFKKHSFTVVFFD